MKQKNSINRLKKQENLYGYLFASPWLIGLIVLGLFPIIMSLYISFTNYNMIDTPKFIGLENYRILLTNDDLFWKSLYNTIYHVIIAVPLTTVLSIILALFLNNRLRGMGIYRTIIYLPNVVNIVALALLWLWLFQPNFGLINQLLSPIYRLFKMEPLGWYLDKNLSKMTLILMGLWTIGGSMVIYLAQMKDIPQSLYESAEIDGAGFIRKTISITLPLMTPAIFFNVIMGIIGSFQVFTTAYIMTSGGPSLSTFYYAYYLYNVMMYDKAMGMASAMAWILLVICLAATILALRLNKYVFYLGEE